MRRILLVSLAITMLQCGGESSVQFKCAAPLRVLWYTKQTEWMHTSNSIAAARFRTVAEGRGWNMTVSDDASSFEHLWDYDVVVFALTSGTTLNAAQRAGFERYIAAGRGVAGFHSATHTDYDWPFMVDLFGATFVTHPAIAPGAIYVTQPSALTSSLPSKWVRTDEYYAFDRDPASAPGTSMLLRLEIENGSPALPPGISYPMAWTRELPSGAQLFYTALGHTDESYAEPAFVTFLTRGIEWAGRSACLHP